MFRIYNGTGATLAHGTYQAIAPTFVAMQSADPTVRMVLDDAPVMLAPVLVAPTFIDKVAAQYDGPREETFKGATITIRQKERHGREPITTGLHLWGNAQGLALTIRDDVGGDETYYHAGDDVDDVIEDLIALGAVMPSHVYSAAHVYDVIQMAPDVAPVAAPVVETAPQQISTLALSRIERHEDMARAQGFAMKAPVYAAGTRVIPLGDDNFRAERGRVDDLPSFGDASRIIANAVRAEQRRDVDVRVSSLALRATDGALDTEEGPMRLGSDAFAQLCGRIGIASGTRYLRDLCDRDMRAHNVNAQIGMRAMDQDARLRTRRGSDGGREAFAVVSQSYAAFDIDRVLDIAAPVLDDAKGEIVYDAETTRLSALALWMPDHVLDLAAGDIFKGGVRVRTADDGGGALVVEAVLWRNLCLNLIIIDEATSETTRARHIGDPNAIRDALREGVTLARAKIADFLSEWGHARTLAFENVEDEIVAVAKACAGDVVPRGLADIQKGVLVPALMRAHRAEPGNTRADVANALTRAAHEGSAAWVPTSDVGAAMERAASRYVRGGVDAI